MCMCVYLCLTVSLCQRRHPQAQRHTYIYTQRDTLSHCVWPLMLGGGVCVCVFGVSFMCGSTSARFDKMNTTKMNTTIKMHAQNLLMLTHTYTHTYAPHAHRHHHKRHSPSSVAALITITKSVTSSIQATTHKTKNGRNRS